MMNHYHDLRDLTWLRQAEWERLIAESSARREESGCESGDANRGINGIRRRWAERFRGKKRRSPVDSDCPLPSPGASSRS